MIKERIKELLSEKGLTQKDLALKLDVKQETISRQIAGNPTLETLTKIAGALEVSIVELFDISVKSDGEYEYLVQPYDNLNSENWQKHEDYLNDKSRNNWELVSIMKMPLDNNKDCVWYYFKRPKK